MQTGKRILPARRRIVISALIVGAALGCSPLSSALAADITPLVSSSTTTVSGTYNENDQVRVTINWSVANAAAGDTFTAALDKALDPRKFVPMNLKDAFGETVATVEITRDSSGNVVRDANGDAVLTFTFTSYASDHTNLSGQAWFDIGFDSSVVTFPGTNTTFPTTIYGLPVTITKSRGAVGNEHLKYGNWRSLHNSEAEVTAQNSDGTLVNPTAGILWTIQLQGGAQSEAPNWSAVTVVDTPAPGQHFNCPLTAPAPSFLVRDASGTWVRTGVPTIDSFSCSPTSFTVVITKDPADQSVYRLRIPTWLDGGTLPTSFANSASLSYVAGEAAPVTYNVSGAVSRSASGGSGTGIIVKPPTGTPKLTITKVALAKKVRAGKNVRWKVTVRSTGTATATNVRVCDSPLDNQSFPLRTATVTVGATTRKAPLTFLNGTGCVSIASLARGASATVIFTTHIPLTGKSRARNTSLASATGVTAVRASARVTVIKVAGRTHIPSPAG
jgi:uncharacterized repeat protein (TIGR01451 family)